MKIRSKLGILMAIVLAFPFLFISEINLTKKIRNTQKVLIQNFEALPISKELLSPENMPKHKFLGLISDSITRDSFLNYSGDIHGRKDRLTDQQKASMRWDLIREKLKHIPYDSEACLIYNDKVLVSSIPELPADTNGDEHIVGELIQKTNRQYLYQFDNPIEEEDADILLLSRTSKKKKFRYLTAVNVIFVTIGIFILVCITLIYSISSTIFQNLVALEEQTVKIANGDFSTPISIDSHEKDNEITSLASNLEKMRQHLEENKKRKDLFIMGVSHDLRTPIAVIKGYLEAISDGIITDEKEKENAFVLISSKVNQLENMINELINFEKLETQQIDEDFMDVNLYQFANPLFESGKTNAAVFKRQISGKIDVSSDLVIRFNPLLATRLVENLFSNAVRYTDENGIIDIQLVENEENITFSIKDNGKGMTTEDQKRIFDLFYRASNSRNEPGMGIGLAVVKNIVDLHRWKIDVKSEPEKGSEFIITIPKQKKI